MKKFASLLIAVGIVASPARAGESDVTKVQMRAERAGTITPTVGKCFPWTEKFWRRAPCCIPM
jgi:hypothetical protein